MDTIQLQVTKREAESSPNGLRRSGKIPAVVYGAGGANAALTLDAREFVRSGLASAGAHLIKFASDDASLNGDMALVKSIQTHPVGRNPIHVDFLRVDMKKPVQAMVALAFVGKSVGVVASGGILQPIRREVEVRALPDRLPDTIEIDVSELDIHDSIHIEDIKVADDVELIFAENFTLVTVTPPVVEKVEEPEELEGVEGALEGEAEGEAPAEDASKEEETPASE